MKTTADLIAQLHATTNADDAVRFAGLLAEGGEEE